MTDGLQRALLLDIPDRIETDRLSMVASRAGQGAEVNAAIVESHAELKLWMPWAKEVPSLEQSEAFARQSAAKWAARETLDFCFMRRDNGSLVGKGGFHTIEWAVPKLEIGYWIRTSCAGQGYATEATRALAEFAHERLGAHRLEITSDTRNVASRRVAEKSGFVLEGIRRASRRDTAGELADSCMHARVFDGSDARMGAVR